MSFYMENNMKIFQKKALLILICMSIVTSSCSKQPVTETPNVVDLMMIGEYGELEPFQISRELELKSTKTYEDYIDLGTSYLWMGEYLKAAEAYEFSARKAETIPQLVGSLYNKAAALAYIDLDQAIITIELATKLQPDNIEVAWLRYALYRYNGDNLGVRVAGDQLVSLDPSLTGNETFLGLDDSGLLLAIVIILSGTLITSIVLVPPEDRKDVVISVMKGYFDTIGIILSPYVSERIAFGQYLVEQLDE